MSTEKDYFHKITNALLSNKTLKWQTTAVDYLYRTILKSGVVIRVGKNFDDDYSRQVLTVIDAHGVELFNYLNPEEASNSFDKLFSFAIESSKCLDEKLNPILKELGIK